jgi:hypothetical protein
MTDFYSILGLEKSASLRDIKAAYRVLAKKYHPDVNKSAAAARQMQSVTEAYETLGDPIKRAEYDQIREMGGGSAQVASEQSVHVACKKCGKVDSTLRVSTITTVWSFVFFSTYRGWSQILCAKCRVLESLKFNLQVLFFGWWGIPWGIIWTIVFFIKNAMGGHQPRENNAVLLATVGKNLIDAGDYIEAEKALIESLKLKDNKYVQDLLRTAKSRAGFKKETNIIKTVVMLKSHPLIYNAILGIIVITTALLMLGGSLRSKEEISERLHKELTSEERVTKDLGIDQMRNDSRVKELHESNTRGMLHQTWIERIFAKINILRGDRWNLPIHLGDSREHVYQVLGDPTDNSDKYIAANEHLQKTIERSSEKEIKNDTKFWMDKGLVISFKDDTVSSITASGNQCATKINTNPIVYGIYSVDDAQTLIAKLGLPYLPNETNSNPDFSLSQSEFEWRLGNLRITRSILSKDQTDDFKKKCEIGYPWGGVTIEDLRPYIQEEKNQEEDKRIKIGKVALSGKEISPKEIFEKYKERIYLVIAYNSQNKPFCFGTGFLYKDAQIISNYHVVEDARKIKVKPLFGGGEEEDVAVEFFDIKADWVVMDKFHNPLKKDRELYPAVQSGDKVETGDPVTVIGNPEGLTGSLSTGVVSSIRTKDGISWVQTTAPISHGSSGSPVFDSKGRWIGLATLSVVDGQNLNLATPNKPIIDQLTSANQIRAINLPLKEHYLKVFNKMNLDGKMISDDPKEKEEAIQGIKSLLEIYPDPYDQTCLLGDLAQTYPNNWIKERIETYDKQIALNLDWDYFPLIYKGDLLWDLENQKQDSEQRELEQKITSENQVEYNASKQAFYNQLRILGAKENIIAAIEKTGGPEKVKGSYWDMVINKLNNDDKVKVVDLLLKCVNNDAQLKRKLNDTFVKVDHTESYKLYNLAIEKAKKEISKDFSEAKKEHNEDIYPNMLDIVKKNHEEVYQRQLTNLATSHASDAYEIGYLYWMMDDNKNAEEWLEKSKKMNPGDTKQADKILAKIHLSALK